MLRIPRHTRSAAVAAALVCAALVSHRVHAMDPLDATTRSLSETTTPTTNNVPFSSAEATQHTIQYILAFLMVLLAAHPLGLLFPRYARLPLITGYLLVGIVAGPFVANLLPAKLVAMLAPSVNALALSFISFQAGQEIYLPELKPQIKSILVLLVVLYGVTMTILTGALFFFNNPFFYDAFDGACQLAIALMFGSIAVLGSPATVMAIKIELNSVGPFTNLMLGATMTAEFVVLVSFSLSRVVSSIYCAKLDISFANLMFTMGVVMANLLVGALIALVIIAIFLIPGGPEHTDESAELLAVQDRASHQNSTTANTTTAQQYLTRSRSSRASLRRLSGRGTEKRGRSTSSLRGDMESGDGVDNLPHPHNAYVEVDEADRSASKKRTMLAPAHLLASVLEWLGSLFGKGFLWLLAGYAFYLATSTISEATIHAYGHSWDVKFEPLLVLMTASCLAGHYSSIRHDMHVILDTAAPYIFLPFFVMTGAALKLDQVANAIPLMSLYVILRYVSIFAACYVGGRFVLKLEPREYNNLWLTMTPQAGVALGLANEVKGLSDDPWAAEFAATIVAAVVVNQIIGPVLCAIGLSRAGESYASRAAKAAADTAAAAAAAAAMASGASGPATVGGPLPKVDEHLVMQNNGDPRPLLPFYQVNHAVVIGEDEMAFEVALELSLYGAHVNVPLLDEERAAKWHQINETILARSANGELIKFKNKVVKGTTPQDDHLQSMAAATDVVIFTGDAQRSLEHAKTMVATFGSRQKCPRLIAVVPDCAYAKQLQELGVLTIQPSIAMANIATRMALLELDLAQQLSNEISTTSNFSTATYFMRRDDDRDSVHSLSELRLPGRRLALGRSVVNHHNVEYDKIAEALVAVNLPPPPPPARVSMFGTTAAAHNPFAARPGGLSVYEHYAVDEADLVDDRAVFNEQFLPSPSGSANGSGGFERGRSQRRSSRGSTRVLRRSRSGSTSSSGHPIARTLSSRV